MMANGRLNDTAISVRWFARHRINHRSSGKLILRMHLINNAYLTKRRNKFMNDIGIDLAASVRMVI